MSGDNDPVIPLANATGGCAVAATLPQGAGRKASRNRGAWPIHGDRTLLEPLCTVFWCRLPVDTGMRNRVICVGLPKWARMPSMVAGSTVA
jgi:hypothetical protein